MNWTPSKSVIWCFEEHDLEKWRFLTVEKTAQHYVGSSGHPLGHTVPLVCYCTGKRFFWAVQPARARVHTDGALMEDGNRMADRHHVSGFCFSYSFTYYTNQ